MYKFFTVAFLAVAPIFAQTPPPPTTTSEPTPTHEELIYVKQVVNKQAYEEIAGYWLIPFFAGLTPILVLAAKNSCADEPGKGVPVMKANPFLTGFAAMGGVIAAQSFTQFFGSLMQLVLANHANPESPKVKKVN